MAFNIENLSLCTNNVKAGTVPALWTYFNEANDVVTATSFFAIRGRFTVGDIVMVGPPGGNRVPEAYRVSALATDSEYATVIRIANSYVNAQTPETVTAVTAFHDPLSLNHDLSLLVTTAAAITDVYTAGITTDRITLATKTVCDHMLCTVTTTGAAPGGLAVLTDYYTRDTSVDGTNCKLAATIGGAAIDITDAGTGVQTLSGSVNNFTLADGVEGQRKLVKLKTDGTLDAQIVPANFQDGNVITFGTALEYANLVFAGGKWNIVETPGGVVT